MESMNCSDLGKTSTLAKPRAKSQQPEAIWREPQQRPDAGREHGSLGLAGPPGKRKRFRSAHRQSLVSHVISPRGRRDVVQIGEALVVTKLGCL